MTCDAAWSPPFQPLLLAWPSVSQSMEASASCAHARWGCSGSRDLCRELVAAGGLIILTIASAFVVEAPLGPGLVHELPSHVTVTVLLGPETRELFTNVQATSMVAVVADEIV